MRLKVIAALAAIGSVSASSCISEIVDKYSLPNLPLTWVNSHLASDEDYKLLEAFGCPTDRPAGAVCPDKPAIGSGFTQLYPNYFLGLTDRGPNQDCEDLSETPDLFPGAVGKSGKGFPVKTFTPAIVHFETSGNGSSSIVYRKSVPLKDSDGNPITGLPNTADDDTPYGKDCVGEPLSYDPSGLDTEDLARIPGTSYVVIVDEYSPSVVIADYKTGIITSRHVPFSKASALSEAKYPIVGDIPDVFVNRRKNRGFEGVVVDGEGKYAIALLQSPMLGADSESTVDNAIIRCAYFSIESMGIYAAPTLTYKYSFAIEASPTSSYFNLKNKPKDIKYSAAQYHSPGKFIALERAKSQVKLFLVDFTKATNLDETRFASNLNLEKETNGAKTAMSVGIIPAEKTLIWDSAPGVGGTVGWEESSKQEGFAIDMVDPTKLWIMDDNDFGLEGNEHVVLSKITLGRSVDGATICAMPDHPVAPQINVEPTKDIKLVYNSTYRISKTVGGGGAENMDVDEELLIAYVANDETSAIDSYSLATSPVTPIFTYKIEGDFAPTSVTVCKSMDKVAIAFANGEDDVAGVIHIVTKDLIKIAEIADEGCYLPDSIKWSEDCSYLVVACEGEGAEVPGSVLVSNFDNADKTYRGTKLATFQVFNSKASELAENGVPLIESKNASLDLQPEFVSILGSTAFITVQEANAIAVVDLAEAKITELKPIGFIDRSKKRFALDASNKDDGINIRNYPYLFGMPQPDMIVPYTAADGKQYLVIANEGDALESEEYRAGDITDPEELNRTAIAGLKELIEDKALLGRIKFSSVEGYDASTNTQHSVYHYGSRSFSIMSMDGTIVFDSGEWFARIMETHFPEIFNANGFDDEDLEASQADLMDNR